MVGIRPNVTAPAHASRRVVGSKAFAGGHLFRPHVR